MSLRVDIESAINRNSAENGSNTPDFILAGFLCGCLNAFDASVNRRSAWYGDEPSAKSIGKTDPLPDNPELVTVGVTRAEPLPWGSLPQDDDDFIRPDVIVLRSAGEARLTYNFKTNRYQMFDAAVLIGDFDGTPFNAAIASAYFDHHTGGK